MWKDSSTQPDIEEITPEYRYEEEDGVVSCLTIFPFADITELNEYILTGAEGSSLTITYEDAYLVMDGYLESMGEMPSSGEEIPINFTSNFVVTLPGVIGEITLMR